jgi:hypothetical protein
MVKRCAYKDENGSRCKKQPYYNEEGETNTLYCSIHKTEDMINLKDKTCIHKDENGIPCKIFPVYNIEGKKEALYCTEHKLNGMVDVKHRTCIHKGCKTRPNFNMKGEIKGLYCKLHKLDGMTDVTSKTCICILENGTRCTKRSSFNTEGEKEMLYCGKHKIDGMVDVHHKQRCVYIGENGIRCKFNPNFNIEGEKRLYCSIHKLDQMIDVRNNTCKSEWCYTRKNEKYDGYCAYCYINLFPDQCVSRNYKTKERKVVEYITTNFPDFTWTIDKNITGGCSKRRPDLILDLGYQIIITEVDEHQHNKYDCSCENKRIMELSQDVGHRPIIFIRFNPDAYTNKKGEMINSCWSFDKNGLCIIKKTKKNEWENRLFTLNEQIQYWTNSHNITTKTIEIIQLFYDGF